MSVKIDVASVEAVLLHDGWHDVLDASFQVFRELEFVEKGRFQRYSSAQGAFLFKTTVGTAPRVSGRDIFLSGPMSSIIAIRTITAEHE